MRVSLSMALQYRFPHPKEAPVSESRFTVPEQATYLRREKDVQA